MKKNLFFVLIAFAFGLGSCTTYNEPKNVYRTAGSEPQINSEDSIYLANCTYYVTNNPDIFGNNVIIFDSIGQMFAELELLNSMNYRELREWQYYNDFYNPILNSIIIHDSVQFSMWNNYGIVFDLNESDTIVNSANLEFLEKAFDDYDEEMKTNFQQYVKVTVDNDSNVFLSPLGVLDEHVFANEKDLFVCRGIIFRFFSDGILTCPFDEYSAYEKCVSLEDVDDLLKVAPSNQVHVDYDPWNRVETRTYKNFKDENFNKFPKHIMEIDFRLYVYRFLFWEWHEVAMNATNYHKNRDGQYRTVACETKIRADVSTQCPYTNKWNVSFNTGWCPMKGGMTYFRKKAFECGCESNAITFINVNAQNMHGCTISDDQYY